MISNSVMVNKQSTPAWVDQSDEELLLAYRDHQDRQAFAVLVHRYERELFSYLRRYLGNAAMAEDAFQATFLQVHLKAKQFEPGRKVRPWLYTIATNQAIDAQRRNKRHRMVSLDRRATQDAEDLGSLLDLLTSKETSPTSGIESEERSQWIHQAVAELPESLRTALTLIYYQGLKYREAADALGLPVGTVKSRLHTAILKLTEAWDDAQKSHERPSNA
ncbi:MAG TPA: sigma-70 family RNA polymerase sigma factor [Pirellulales bacterium]|jgi:RNA polymerase sigma-70 factor (ECF subfamily)|nr:sigma-70 family RNA polymerase sigma factor [Pirellulales bacterium]